MSIWVRLLCLVSVVAAHGPQHHAFAHGHDQASEGRDICPASDLHAESASDQPAEPDSGCLACKWHSASAIVGTSDNWTLLPDITRSVIDDGSRGCTDDSGCHRVRGPPFEIG